MTTYIFDVFRMFEKVDSIARAICRSYNIAAEWEDVAQTVKMVLFSRVDTWDFKNKITSEGYEKAVIANAVKTECDKILSHNRHVGGKDWYTLDWIRANINALLEPPAVPTYTFVEDNRIGVDARMVTTHHLLPEEYADFNEAFALLTDKQRDIITGDDSSDSARSLRSKAFKRLHIKMNNIAKERGN